jgi:hypothetical protein
MLQRTYLIVNFALPFWEHSLCASILVPLCASILGALCASIFGALCVSNNTLPIFSSQWGSTGSLKIYDQFLAKWTHSCHCHEHIYKWNLHNQQLHTIIYLYKYVIWYSYDIHKYNDMHRKSRGLKWARWRGLPPAGPPDPPIPDPQYLRVYKNTC